MNTPSCLDPRTTKERMHRSVSETRKYCLPLFSDAKTPISTRNRDVGKMLEDATKTTCTSLYTTEMLPQQTALVEENH